MSDEDLLVEQSGARLTITLNRPQIVNALTVNMLDGINRALDRAEADSEIRVIVFRGNGPKGFCSGLDRKEMNRLAEQSAEEHMAIFGKIYGTAKRVDTFPKPVISLVHGYVIAAGGQLATAADLIIAAENTRMVEPEMRMTGFNDDSWAMRLGRILGPVRAKRYVLLAEPLSGREAYDLGLVSLVVPDDELDSTGDRLAEQIAGYLPQVVSKTLGLIDRGSGAKSG